MEINFLLLKKLQIGRGRWVQEGLSQRHIFSRISFLDKVPEQKEETLVTENFMSAPLPFGTFLMLAENRLSTGQDS